MLTDGGRESIGGCEREGGARLGLAAGDLGSLGNGRVESSQGWDGEDDGGGGWVIEWGAVEGMWEGAGVELRESDGVGLMGFRIAGPEGVAGSRESRGERFSFNWFVATIGGAGG